ncbi:DUF1289 domain-containing protein [Pseudoalteromonas sp. ZZD1]|uniref:DUF1289 domain-containing protein n=1 Tax=Pseudoalteromonas sp. ZZD1 TaxID=3139395 RepID=UPI003BAAE716
MDNLQNLPPDNPCIRCCCLDDKDTCIGCFRTLDEILNWHNASTEQKIQIIAACKVRKTRCKNKGLS